MRGIPPERRWPIIITSVLVGNLLLGIAMIRLAGRDDHFAVEPDYYRRALAWDDVQAQERRNQALGWQLDAVIDSLADSGPTTFTLAVTDPLRNALPADSATIDAMPIAHASEVLHATLLPGDDEMPGTVHTSLPFHREGLWEFRIAVMHGTDRFTTTLRYDLSRHRAGQRILARPGQADSVRLARGADRQ